MFFEIGVSRLTFPSLELWSHRYTRSPPFTQTKETISMTVYAETLESNLIQGKNYCGSMTSKIFVPTFKNALTVHLKLI